MLKIFRGDPPTRWSDEALLARYVADGDMQYLGILYQRYMPMVYGVAMKILRDNGKAEDAVMGVFESLILKAREHQVESFRGWLYVMARNHCLMEWRKAQRIPEDTQSANGALPMPEAVEPAFELEMPLDHAKPLEECLDALPERQKQSVEMFYYKEKSYKDIALIMQEDVGKVRSYIQNGRRNLRICLEDKGIYTL